MQYSIFNTNTDNSENENLEKMARQFSGSNNYKNMVRDVENERSKYKKNIKKGVQFLEDQNKYMEGFDSNLFGNSEESVDISRSMSNVSSNTNSTLMNKLREKRKPLRIRNNHTDNMKHDDIIKHVKKCYECRENLFSILKKNDDESDSIDQIIKDNGKSEKKFNFTEIRDILIMVILGIIVIVLIDIFLRK